MTTAAEVSVFADVLSAECQAFLREQVADRRRCADALIGISAIVKAHLETDPSGLQTSKQTVLERILDEIQPAMPHLFQGAVDQADGFAADPVGALRRPAGITWDSEGSRLIAVCDDGSVWTLYDGYGEWVSTSPAIPGTAAVL